MKQKYRLTRSVDFKRVRRLGKSYAHPLAVIIVAKGEAQNPRVGIVATRAVGSAVHRNHIKRRMRAIVDQFLPEIQGIYDLVIIARESSKEASFLEIHTAVYTLLGKAKLIVSNNHDAGRSALSY